MSARIVKEPKKEISMISMYIGQIGLFRYNDEIVIGLRTYTGLVDLNHPKNTWPLSSEGSLMVEPLPSGTIIEIEAL